jgi:hypothetical protein
VTPATHPAADVVLAEESPLPIKRSWFGSEGFALAAAGEGQLHDVRLGPLARFAVSGKRFRKCLMRISRLTGETPTW